MSRVNGRLPGSHAASDHERDPDLQPSCLVRTSSGGFYSIPSEYPRGCVAPFSNRWVLDKFSNETLDQAMILENCSPFNSPRTRQDVNRIIRRINYRLIWVIGKGRLDRKDTNNVSSHTFSYFVNFNIDSYGNLNRERMIVVTYSQRINLREGKKEKSFKLGRNLEIYVKRAQTGRESATIPVQTRCKKPLHTWNPYLSSPLRIFVSQTLSNR